MSLDRYHSYRYKSSNRLSKIHILEFLIHYLENRPDNLLIYAKENHTMYHNNVYKCMLSEVNNEFEEESEDEE